MFTNSDDLFVIVILIVLGDLVGKTIVRLMTTQWEVRVMSTIVSWS